MIEEFNQMIERQNKMIEGLFEMKDSLTELTLIPFQNNFCALILKTPFDI